MAHLSVRFLQSKTIPDESSTWHHVHTKKEIHTMDMQEQMDFIHEIFSPSLPRLGAGDDASTQKALAMLLETGSRAGNASRSRKLKVLDIGCGNGTQTIRLAKEISGTVLAVDNHPPYLDELRRRAAAAGVAG
jgi:cyclopropane fatty-acyl-phospholipid synthase-like methyltransferase